MFQSSIGVSCFLFALYGNECIEKLKCKYRKNVLCLKLTIIVLLICLFACIVLCRVQTFVFILFIFVSSSLHYCLTHFFCFRLFVSNKYFLKKYVCDNFFGFVFVSISHYFVLLVLIICCILLIYSLCVFFV